MLYNTFFFSLANVCCQRLLCSKVTKQPYPIHKSKFILAILIIIRLYVILHTYIHSMFHSILSYNYNTNCFRRYHTNHNYNSHWYMEYLSCKRNLSNIHNFKQTYILNYNAITILYNRLFVIWLMFFLKCRIVIKWANIHIEFVKSNLFWLSCLGHLAYFLQKAFRLFGFPIFLILSVWWSYSRKGVVCT